MAALYFAAAPLRADRDFVLAAVRVDGVTLQHAAESLKADREVALEAVRTRGGALRFAAEPLKADRGVVLEAVQQNDHALRYAAAPLKADVQFMHVVALRRNWHVARLLFLAQRADATGPLAAIGEDALDLVLRFYTSDRAAEHLLLA